MGSHTDYAAIAAAAIAGISSLVSAGKEAEAQKLRESIVAQYGPDILPHLEKAQAEQAGGSAFESAPSNDQGRATQMGVDEQLANIYDTGGNTAADEAAYDVARRGVSQRAASQAGDIGIEAARRGQTGSGLGATLAAQSGQGELEALAGLNANIASSARERALQALTARGQQAGQMRAQDWAQTSGRASATDLMNRFNASQRQQTGMYNTGLPQQGFDNNMARLAAQGAAVNGQAAGIDRSAAATRQTGAGLANGALSYGQSWDDSPDNPKNKK